MPNNKIDNLLKRSNSPANDEIQRGKGYQLSTDIADQDQAAEPPTAKEKALPVDRQSVRIRKDLLLRSEEQKLNRKKKGEPITLAEIVELALEAWLEVEEGK